MTRITGIPDDLVNELRQAYREKGSVLVLIRLIQGKKLDNRYLDYELMILDAFRLSLRQIAWMSWWCDDPVPGQDHITDSELEEKMIPEIESRRHLWDRPAADD